MRIHIAFLKTTSNDERLACSLENLLRFSGIGLQVAVEIERCGTDAHGLDRAAEIFCGYDSRSIRIFLGEMVLQPPEKQESMDARTPFMVITSEYVRVLDLSHSQRPAERRHSR